MFLLYLSHINDDQSPYLTKGITLCRTVLAGAFVGTTQLSLRMHFYRQEVVQVSLGMKCYVCRYKPTYWNIKVFL